MPQQVNIIFCVVFSLWCSHILKYDTFLAYILCRYLLKTGNKSTFVSNWLILKNIRFEPIVITNCNGLILNVCKPYIYTDNTDQGYEKFIRKKFNYQYLPLSCYWGPPHWIPDRHGKYWGIWFLYEITKVMYVYCPHSNLWSQIYTQMYVVFSYFVLKGCFLW